MATTPTTAPASVFESKVEESAGHAETGYLPAATLYTIPVTAYLGAEYIPFVQDVARMVVLQFVIQIMLMLKTSELSILFNINFIELVFYIVLGVAVYWLIVRKMVRFV